MPLLLITWMLSSDAASQPSVPRGRDPLVAADLLIAEAEANPAFAKVKLAEARALAPNEAEVFYVSARFALQDKDNDAALTFLDRAVALDPEHPQAVYARAMLLFVMGRDSAAKLAFTDVTTHFPTDLRAPYYLGLLALRANDKESALAFFDKAAAGTEDEAKLAAAQREIVLSDLGKSNPASLERTAASLPSGKLKGSLESLIAAKKEQAYRLPWLYARLEVGGELDTNASLGALRYAEVNEQLAALGATLRLPAPQIGFRIFELARIGARPLMREKITLEADFTFVNANHVNDRANLAVYDYGGPSAAARIMSRVGTETQKFDLGFELSVRDLWTGGYTAHLLTTMGLAPYAAVVIDQKRSFYVFANMELREFMAGNPQASENSPNDRDGWHFAPGVMQTFGNNKVAGSFALTYVEETARGNGQAGTAYLSNFAARGGALALNLRFFYKDVFTFTLGAAGSARYFERAVPQRVEVRIEPNAAMHFYFLRFAGLGITYAYTRSEALLTDGKRYDPLTYDRHVVGLSLIGHY